jgi:hypothetical protein
MPVDNVDKSVHNVHDKQFINYYSLNSYVARV